MSRIAVAAIILAFAIVGCSLGGQTLQTIDEGEDVVVGNPGISPAEVGASSVRFLKVMSFNIHHGTGRDGQFNLDRVVQVIRSTGADIVGLQEVDKNYSARSQNLDVALELANRLQMYYAFGPALKRISFSADYDMGYYGNAVLSRYPIVAAENHVLERMGANEDRACLFTTIDVGGIQVNFAATHLGLDDAERLAHVEEIMERFGKLTGPRVLVGDWNATPDKPEVIRVTEGMIDAAHVTGRDTDYTFAYKSPIPGVPNVRIDYIFVSELGVNKSLVVATDASDHWPVVAEIELPLSQNPEGGETGE